MREPIDSSSSENSASNSPPLSERMLWGTPRGTTHSCMNACRMMSGRLLSTGATSW